MDGVPPPEDGDGRPIAMEGQAAEDLAASALAARGLVTPPGGLGFDALAVAADGHVQQNANASALVTARTLLPNAPLPAAMEINLPVLQVQRKNVTKAAAAEPSTPWRPTREEILRDSPGRVTRSKLAMLLREGTSSQTDTTSPMRMPTAAAPKKMTPKRKLHIAYQPSQASQCSSHGQAPAGQPSQASQATS
uniref:Uncharacterized protein n=1 Tax=Oryza rufipogon TaxID=4529 RepID=A0A0E0PHP6_ORYRU